MGSVQNYVGVTRRPPDVEDYIDMLRRYRSWIVAPMFAGLVIAVVAAFFQPDIFESYAVMQITPPTVPEKMIATGLTVQMADRLQQLQTEILSRSMISEIIQKPGLDLYKKELRKAPLEDVIQLMKKNIHINYIGGAGNDSRYKSAFEIRFRYYDKYKASMVVRELVTRFTDSNAQADTQAAGVTTDFFNDELRIAKDKMDKAEAALTEYSLKNPGGLPQQATINTQSLFQLQMQARDVGAQIARDQQDKIMYDNDLATNRNEQNAASSSLERVVSERGSTVKNQTLIDLGNKITAAKSHLASLQKLYGDNFPDIQTLKAEIGSLDEQQTELQKEDMAQQQTAGVTTTRRVVDPEAERNLRVLREQQARIQTLMAAKDVEIQELTRQKAGIDKEIAAVNERMKMAPLNEQQYSALMAEVNMAKANYAEAERNSSKSQTARNVSEHKGGEMLGVLDAANVPDKAVEPDRWIWAFTGTFVGLVAGLILAAAKEMKNASLKNLKDVRAYTNMPILSSIPLLENALLVRRKRRLVWLAWSSAVIVGCVLMSASVYYYVSSV